MPMTFRKAVGQFWDWFPTVSEKYEGMLIDQRGQDVVAEVQEKMHELIPSMCWVFGSESVGHSFTLTGEGQIAKQLLAEYWLSQAVDVPGWQFFASKQAPSSPEQVGGFAIGVGDNLEVDCERFVVSTQVDEEHECIDIHLWHPTFEQLSQEHHYQISFIFLDELLGEFGTQMWIGDIHVAPFDDDANVKPMVELPAFIKSASEYHKWEKLSPLESYSVYEMQEQAEFPRGDTVFGSTCIQPILSELLSGGGKLSEDPTDGAGAEFAYVAVDRSVFPEGQEIDVRENIENTIDEALRKAGSGRSLGGAFGLERCYIDFLLFDGAASRTIVEEQLKQLQLGPVASLVTFL